MNAGQAFFGLYGMAVFVIILFYNLKVMENFLSEEKISLLNFFEEGQGKQAFTVFTACFAFYALTLLASGTGNVYDLSLQVAVGIAGQGSQLNLVSTLPHLGAAVLFAGLAYFLRSISLLTRT